MGLLVSTPKITVTESQNLACARKGISNGAGEEEGRGKRWWAGLLCQKGLRGMTKSLWYLAPVVSAPRKLNQKDGKLEVHLGNLTSQCQRAGLES